LNLGFVVHVIDINLKAVLLLEVVLHVDLSDKDGVQIVVDDFRLTKLRPLVPRLLVQYDERIRAGKGIQIRQSQAREAELELLGKSAASNVRSCENCVVNVLALAELAATDSFRVLMSGEAAERVSSCCSCLITHIIFGQKILIFN